VPAISILRGGRLRLTACVLGVICTLALAAAQWAEADTSQYVQSASALTLPSGGQMNGSAAVYAEACGSTDSCLLVGSYKPASGGYQAYVQQIVDGRAGQATEVPLPSNADTSVQDAYLLGVSCTATGPCVAYGAYEDQSGTEVPMVVTIVEGMPATAVELTPPPGSAGTSVPDVSLSAVGCAPSGTCLVAGTYATAAGDYEPLVVPVQNGVVQVATSATLPANADPSDPSGELDGVACQSSSWCTAVGAYETGGSQMPLVVSIADGVPGAGAEAAIPQPAAADPDAYLSDVACPTSGACEAIGEYQNASGDQQNLVVAINQNGLGSATAVTPPANAYADYPDVVLDGLSCSSASLCVAAGYDFYDSSYDSQAVLVTITAAGVIAHAQTPPANQYSGAESSSFSNYANDYGSSVSCAPSGPCLTDGYYQNGASTDAGMVVQISASGQIGSVQTTPTPVNAAANPSALPLGVGCDAAGSCDVIGLYADTTGDDEPYEVTEQTPLSVTSSSLIGATQGSVYQAALSAAGAWGAYSWSIPSGSLPAGLNLNPQTGEISGTPTASGSSTFTVEVTGTGLGSPVPTATEQLTLTVAAQAQPTLTATADAQPTQPAQPARTSPLVRLLSSSTKVSANRLGVKLACSGVSCAGMVRIETLEVRTVKRSRKQPREHRTVVIGTARYTDAVGHTRTLSVTLNSAGRRALAKAHNHRLAIQLLATVSGGAQASRRETISIAVKRRK
jgi:cytochrome c551/c552